MSSCGAVFVQSTSIVRKIKMPKKIPKGWLKTTLGEITEPSHGRIAPDQKSNAPYIGLEHIQPHTMQLLGQGRASSVKSASSVFRKGDVLYGKMRPYLNKVWLANFDGVCSSEFLVFQKRPKLNTEFLALRLNARDFVAYSNSQSSGERPRVHFDKISSFPILLPPVEEQERIVAKIELVFGALRRADTASERAQARLSKLRSAILDGAVSGALTHLWRQENCGSKDSTESADELLERLTANRRVEWETSELQRLMDSGKEPKTEGWKNRYPEPASARTENLPEIPNEWAWASLDQIGELNRGRSRHRPRGDARLYGGPYPFIQTGDIRRSGGTLREHTQTYSEFGLAQSRLWPAGTLGITVAANIAESGILEYPACFPDSVVGFQQQAHLLNVRFVEYFIRSKRAELERYAPATAQKNINLDILASLAIPLPPLDEQNEIVAQVQQRLATADQLAEKIELQLSRSREAHQLLLQDAFAGKLLPQNDADSSTNELLKQLKMEKSLPRVAAATSRSESEISSIEAPEPVMKTSAITPTLLTRTLKRLPPDSTVEQLFAEAGCKHDQVTAFYGAMKAAPTVRAYFEQGAAPREKDSIPLAASVSHVPEKNGRFRLVELWLESFKNLKNYTAAFESAHGLDVVMGWNGTGKSNLFESLVIIFRDLHDWWARNRWPDEPMHGYRLVYEIDEQLIKVVWDPKKSKRPVVSSERLPKTGNKSKGEANVERTAVPLPKFVFGYYSGPTNRLAEHFLPMNQAHYVRLRDATSDDPATLAQLLEQRRFFCAETHHAKYVLLAFCYKEDPDITAFLKNRLRIEGFESALFVIRRPRWARSGATATDFWGATGVMRRVLERLRQFAVAPMVVEQIINDGYRTAKEDHYYFFLPDLERLHAFAAEYENARTFFLALESTDFSELIYDVKIQVRVNTFEANEVAITFREMSEGEQQLLMVLGLMRFTKSFQSLVLLDEPDTHLNPHWSVEYLKLLTDIMKDGPSESDEQQTSQILISTHDPLVIAGLVKEQVHLMKRDKATGAYEWMGASVNPKGLGFTGILTSEMFGFRSDLDESTLADLDDKVRLMAKAGTLAPAEEKQLEGIDQRLSEAGFQKAFSDPYYAAFVRAWGKKYSQLMAGQQFLSATQREEIERVAQEVLEEAIAEVNREATN